MNICLPCVTNLVKIERGNITVDAIPFLRIFFQNGVLNTIHSRILCIVRETPKHTDSVIVLLFLCRFCTIDELGLV